MRLPASLMNLGIGFACKLTGIQLAINCLICSHSVESKRQENKVQEGWNNGSDLIIVEDLASNIYLQFYSA